MGLAALLRDHDPLLAYVDHRLRGPRAGRRERGAVKATARALGLDLVRTRVTVRGRSEASARRARYDVLHRLARRHACTALATAHTADDRAETVLAALLRGTGLRGLAALRPARTIRGLPRVRPALGWRRSELRALVRDLETIDDRSNRNTAWTRPRLRGLGLPALEARLGQDPVPLLCGLADLAEELRAVLEDRAARKAPAADRIALLGECAAAFPYLVEALRPEGPPLTRRAYGSLHAYLAAGRTGRVHVTPGGESWHLKRGGKISISPT